ncbi:MAG TPA: prolyl oligopeptidase family serine peptidase [Fulvivirga sp.]|nr:prolyl oligopeptidase family serine peptidase [Fulvivirga sp.]
MLLKNIIVINCLLLSCSAFGQSIRYSGKVIGHEDQKPIPFAYVKIKGVALGTVTQSDGKFELLVPEKYQKGILEFSYVGYKTKSVLMSSIVDPRNINIMLVIDTKMLQEVIVMPRKMESPKSILRKALSKIPENYPTEKFGMNAYYRETIQENGAFIMMADASVEYNLNPYQTKNFKWKDYAPTWINLNKTMSSFSLFGGSRLHRYHFHNKTLKGEKVKIIDSRASANLSKTHLNASTEGGPLGIIGKDRVKFQEYFMDKFSKFDYELGEISNSDGSWSYVISFTPKISVEKMEKKKRPYDNPMKLAGKIYIDQDSYAITKMNYSVPSDYKKFICGYKGWSIRHFAYSVEVEYEKNKGKYFLSKMRQEDEFIIEDTLQNILTPYAAVTTLNVNKIYTENIPEIADSDNFANVDANRLFDYPLEYNNNFWRQYTLLHPVATIDSTIRKDMESTKTLEKQFANKNIRDTTLLPPIAKQIPEQKSMYGIDWTDDYSWLKDTQNPRGNKEVMNYLEAENAYTENYFAPLRKDQRNIYSELTTSLDRDFVSLPKKYDNYYYYYKLTGDNEHPVYYRRKEDSKKEEVLLDVNEMAREQPYYRVTGLISSPNHKIIAYAENKDGSDRSVVKFKEVASGKLLPDSLVNIGQLEWINNNELLYTKLEKRTLRPNEVYHHQLLSTTENDKLIYYEKDQRFSVSLDKSKSKEFIFMEVYSSSTSECYFYRINDPKAEFKLLKARKEGVRYSMQHYNQYFFIATDENAPNSKIVKVDTANYTSDWQTVIPHNKEVFITNFEIFKKYLVLNERINAVDKIKVINLSDNKEHFIDFKEDIYSSAISYNPDFDTDTVRIYYQSYKTQPTYYNYNMETKKKVLLKKSNEPNIMGSSAIKVKRLWATARDGEKIPIDIIYNKYYLKNKKTTVNLYITSYGAYGSAMTPFHSNSINILLNRGFIYAIPHIRGGSDLGMTWYYDGKLLNKKNTFTDFIDCTEYLIKEGYVKNGNVVAEGGSAGGLLMGAIANMRPDLYKLIILDVPFVDVTNTMLDPKLPLTTVEYQEWGSPYVKKEFKYIKSYSPYDNVKEQQYPNMLFITGLNDTRVGYWEPAKMVAKLRTVNTGKNKILLNVDFNSGHGGAAGRFGSYRELAYKYAFILDFFKTDNESTQPPSP